MPVNTLGLTQAVINIKYACQFYNKVTKLQVPVLFSFADMLQTFTLIHKTEAGAEPAYDMLLDLKKFGALHPYMTLVEIIDRQLHYTEYRVNEEVFIFGFIKNNPEYSVRVIEMEKQKHIRYTSQVKRFIFLSIDFFIEKQYDGSTVIHEKLSIRCNKLIALVFSDILRRSHAIVFAKLRNLQAA